jgi:hypothetical protein
MNDAAETAAARLSRDRAAVRERERDEARAEARIAAEKLAILSAENDRLSTENARSSRRGRARRAGERALVPRARGSRCIK